MIKIGLAGCGFMGDMHAACYRALAELGVQVTAVADVRPEFAKKLADTYGAKLFDTAEDMIEHADVDVIDICLPTHLHAKLAVQAMKKGRDVFLEKPVCIREDEMELLLATERETGSKVQVGQVIRLWDEYAWLKGVTARGEFGKFRSGVFQRLSAKPTWASNGWLHKAELSGGVAVDMHVHDVDFVRYLLGDPDTVQAVASRDADGVIQEISAVYGYGKDVAVSVEAGWDYPAAFPFTATYRVRFEKAAVTFAGGAVTVYPYDGEPYQPKIEAQYHGDNAVGGNISSLGGYYNELKYFIEGIKGEHPLEIATLEEAIKSVRLVKKEIETTGGLVAK